MGKFDDYNRRMVDVVHEQWLIPPSEDDYEPEYECCMCDAKAEYEVCGSYYCESCLHSEFRI